MTYNVLGGTLNLAQSIIVSLQPVRPSARMPPLHDLRRISSSGSL